jgi:hypothetical protein
MALDVRWLIAGRIVYIAPQGELDADALSEVVARARDVFTPTQVVPIHLIVDLNHAQREDTLIPALKEMLELVRKLQPAPPLAGWTIFLDPAPNQIVKSIGASATQVIRLRTRYMSEMALAVEFLYEIDETLTVK